MSGNPELKLGSIALSNRYWLAPMAGITNAPFRLLMREYGAGAVVSELISATGLQYGGEKTLELCQTLKGESPVGLQIFGENAEHLAAAAQRLASWPQSAARFRIQPDFIDINLGCPVPKVVSKGGGSAMLRDPEKLFRTLVHVKQAISIPLTIKIRTGWDSTSINAHECVAAAAEAGVTSVAIHGRTRAQGYEGRADWDLIAEVKAKAKPNILIIGNGDILTAEQAIDRLRNSGCDAVMIGRGALRDPFIFLRIAAAEARQKAELNENYWSLIIRHTELMQSCFKDYFTGIQLRKFMTWYSAGMEGASQFRKRLYEMPQSDQNLNAVLALGRKFFQRPNATKQSSFLSEPFLQGGHG